MKSMNDRLREMIEGSTGGALCPARITRFTPQEDGYTLRQIFDADGKCIFEEIITDNLPNAWQIESIKEALKEADAGNFATDEEVARVFASYGVDTDLETTS